MLIFLLKNLNLIKISTLNRKIFRVLKALTRKFKLHEDVNIYEIAKKCPPNFTGADMYALCADAWFHAARRKVRFLTLFPYLYPDFELATAFFYNKQLR